MVVNCKILVPFLLIAVLVSGQELSPASDVNKIPSDEGIKDSKPSSNEQSEKLTPKKLPQPEKLPNVHSESQPNESPRNWGDVSGSIFEKSNQSSFPFSRRIQTSHQRRNLEDQTRNLSPTPDQVEQRPRHTASRRSPATDGMPSEQDDGQNPRQGRRLRGQGQNRDYRQGDGRSGVGQGSSYRPPLNQDSEGFRPYAFNYIAETDEGKTSHQQSADMNGRVSGSYSMELYDGRRRVVDYNADENGFKARIDTNEPGTSSEEQPADATFYTTGSRPGMGNQQGIYNRQPDLSGQRGVRTVGRRSPNTNFDGSGDRRAAATQSNRGQRNLNNEEGMFGYDRRSDNNQRQAGRGLMGTSQRSGRDMGIQDPSGIARSNFQDDRFSGTNDNSRSIQDGRSPLPSGYGDRGYRSQDIPYQPADHARPLNRRDDVMGGSYGSTGRSGLRGISSRSRPGPSNQDFGIRGQPSANFGPTSRDGMPNPGDFTQTRLSGNQEDPSFYGWYRRSTVSGDENSSNIAGQRNTFEPSRNFGTGVQRDRTIRQDRNTRRGTSDEMSYTSQGQLPRQPDSRQGTGIQPQFNRETGMTPSSRQSSNFGGRSPSRQSPPGSFASNQGQGNSNFQPVDYNSPQATPDSFSPNERGTPIQSFDRQNEVNSRSSFGSSLPNQPGVQGFGRPGSQPMDQFPRNSNDRINNEQVYSIRTQSPQPNFGNEDRQSNIRGRQENFNPAQRRLPESSVQSTPDNFRQRSPGGQNINARDSSFRSGTGLRSGEMPRNFHNYGTYWYSGSMR